MAEVYTSAPSRSSCLRSLTCGFLLLGLTFLGTGCQSDKVKAERAFERGKRYFERQKFAEADIEFQKSVKANPQIWEPRFYLALSEIKLGRMEEAYRNLNAVIEQQSSFVPARLDVAELLMPSNKTESRSQIDEVLSLDPDNARAFILSAKLAMMDRQYPEALEKCNRATQLDPRSDQTWGTCGIAALGAKKNDLAEEYFRHALSVGPESPENYRNLTNALLLQGRGQEAEPLVTQATFIARSIAAFV